VRIALFSKYMIGDFLRVCDLAGWELFDKKKGGHESSLTEKPS